MGARNIRRIAAAAVVVVAGIGLGGGIAAGQTATGTRATPPPVHGATWQPGAVPGGGFFPRAVPLSRFQPYPPSRLFDSRESGAGGPLGPRGTRTLVFPASTGLPADATALVFNLTTTDVTADTYITVWPAGTAKPGVAAINVPPRSTRSNQVVVPLGRNTDGTPAVTFYNNAGSTNVVGDLAGIYRSSSDGTDGYTAVTPSRVLDTRPNGPVGPNGEVVVDLSGKVPEGTASVTMNITGIASTGTYVTAYPDGVSPRPAASSLNIDAGQTTPNLVTVQLPADRKIRLYNHVGSTQLIADLAGYYTVDGPGSYQPVTPVRVLDTRNSGGPLGAGATRSVALTGQVGAGATAATVNITGIAPNRDTYLTAFATGTTKPGTSNLNLAPGQTLSNLGNIPLGGQDRALSVYNNAGSTGVAVDLSGYFVTANP